MDWCLEDPRLDMRAEVCFRALEVAPHLSFPNIFRDPSQQVGFYRFINNPRVDFRDLMAAIESQSLTNTNKKDLVLAIHDTTQVKINHKSELIQEFRKKEGRSFSGFFAHVSLLVTPDAKSSEVFGPCGLTLWTRGEGVKEAPRWFNHAQHVESLRSVKTTVHLMDREGDAYDIIGNLVESDYRFVVRLAHDRLIEDDEAHRLFEFMSTKDIICEREVELTRRTASIFKKAAQINPAREYRTAKLSVTASEVKFKKGSWASKALPSTITVNVIRVFEQNPPEGEKPVQWFLVTSEPITTPAEILTVIDYYRKRWLIEEFFKALKSGCNLEERLLESADAWHNVFVLFLPIAAKLLNLREIGSTPLKGSKIFSPHELAVLKIQSKRTKLPLKTLDDAKMIIARIGGYSKGKWPPGWIVLGRGYDQLRSWAEGYGYASNQNLC